MRYRAVRCIVPALLLATLTAAAAPAPAGFSVILERDGTTWRATCERGCDWTSLSGRKPALMGSTVTIDNQGITLGAASSDSALRFAFEVTADGTAGWHATGLVGTGWKALAFECASVPCRARVTDTGVESIP